MADGLTAASTGRRFLSDLVDLVVAVVMLVSGLYVEPPHWESSLRGPLVIAVTIGYFVFVSWTGRGLGGLVTVTQVVDRRDGGRLSPGRALWRGVVLVVVSGALAMIAFGVGIGVLALSGLATGEAVWPLVASIAFAIIVPPLVDTVVGAGPGRRGLWDRLSGSATTSTPPRDTVSRPAVPNRP